jgi:nucleoid-associated protein YgaU
MSAVEGERDGSAAAVALATAPGIAPQHGIGLSYTQQYVVKKGDSLSKITEESPGDEMPFPKIFEANRDQLKNPNEIKP